MFGKLSPKDLKRFMKQFGIDFKEVEAKEVLIKLEDRDIVIKNPNVIVTTFQGQKIYQISGEEEIIEKAKFSEDDIKFVAEQTGVDEDIARKALEKSGGDIAKAIMLIQEKKV